VRDIARDQRGVINQFFVIIIGILLVVVLLLVGNKVLSNMFCMHSVSAVANDVERVRETLSRVYAGAEGSVDSLELHVPAKAKYCFIRGQIYIVGSCVSEGYKLPNLIVHNPQIDSEIRAKVEEMASLIDAADDETSTSTLCLTAGFYSVKFERTAGHVNLYSVFGTRE